MCAQVDHGNILAVAAFNNRLTRTTEDALTVTGSSESPWSARVTFGLDHRNTVNDASPDIVVRDLQDSRPCRCYRAA